VKLSLAITVILVELGAGVLLTMPLVPIKEVRSSFFTFHSLMAMVCFVLAACICGFVLRSSPWLTGMLVALALLCIGSFSAVRLRKFDLMQYLHVGGSMLGIACLFGLAAYWLSPFALWRWWSTILGCALLGTAHNAMALAHWYLISRNLSFAYLIRITKLLLLALGLRSAYLVFYLYSVFLNPTDTLYLDGRLLSINGDLVFFLFRVLWGLALPLVLAFMAWRCAVGKSNQAATGLLYLCEFSVLFGELFAAYLMI